MYSKIKWFNFYENQNISQAWKKILKLAKNPNYLTLRLAAKKASFLYVGRYG